MMTLKDIKDFVRVFDDDKCDNYDVVLWDYENQRTADWGGAHSLSHPNKEITFSITLPPVDGEHILDKIKNHASKYYWTKFNEESKPDAVDKYDVCTIAADGTKEYSVLLWDGEEWVNYFDEVQNNIVAYHKILRYNEE